MKLSEAKRIVGNMINWSMKHQGIDVTAERITESLEDLLKANKIVSKWNDRQKKKLVDGVGSISYHMTIAPRGIAALYTAMSFEGNWEENAESIVQYQNKYVFVITINPKEEEE